MEPLELKMTTDLTTALPAVIDFNFEELKAQLGQRLYHYNHLVVTEDTIKDAKDDRANLRKLREAIETRRKEVKKQCEQPYKAFEARVKELTALIDAPIMAIDGQVKGFEDRERMQKQAEIEAAYDELVPDSLWEIIPLDRILDKKWLNKSTTMKAIREELTAIVKHTNTDLAYIGTVDSKYVTAVRAKYIETLDIDKALAQRDALMAAERQFQQPEVARTAFQPQAEEKPPVAVQKPDVEPAPIHRQDEKLYSLKLAFRLTQAQANALKSFLTENGIQYTKIQ